MIKLLIKLQGKVKENFLTGKKVLTIKKRGCLKSGIRTQASLPANACKGGLKARTPTF